MSTRKLFFKSTTTLTTVTEQLETVTEPQQKSIEHQNTATGDFWDVSIPFLLDSRVEHIAPGDPLWEQARRRLREHWRTKYQGVLNPVPNKAALLLELKAYADELG
jgi:hypothetical protein